MTLWSRRVSPVRLLLCAVFMGVAFVLASWTSASADDRRLLSAVDKAVPSVGKVVEDATSAVASTSAIVPVVDEVAPPVAKVVEVIEKPAVVVDTATEDVVQRTTKALSENTVRVTDTVKDIAPVSSAVVEPVVEVVVPSSPDAEPAPLPDLPDAIGLPVVETLEPQGSGASSSVAPATAGPSISPASTPPAEAAAVGPAARSKGEKPSAATGVDAVAMPSSVFASLAGGSPSDRAPAGSPSGPLAVAGGSVPTLGGASTTGAPDAGLTPSSVDLPQPLSPAVASERTCHAPGPCPDPGSRPG